METASSLFMRGILLFLSCVMDCYYLSSFGDIIVFLQLFFLFFFVILVIVNLSFCEQWTFLRQTSWLQCPFTMCLQSKFRSMCLRSCHFYCHFSAQAIVFPVSGHFFYCPERVLPRSVISWGEPWSWLMGVLLSCHMFVMTWGLHRVDMQGNSSLRAAVHGVKE